MILFGEHSLSPLARSRRLGSRYTNLSFIARFTNGTADLAADRRENRASFPSFSIPIAPFFRPAILASKLLRQRATKLSPSLRCGGRDAKGQNKNKTRPI